MINVAEDLKTFGAVFGAVALLWNVWSAIRSYLTLALELETAGDDVVLVKMTLTNSALTSKMISYAAVVVSPEDLLFSTALTRLSSSGKPRRPRPFAASSSAPEPAAKPPATACSSLSPSSPTSRPWSAPARK